MIDSTIHENYNQNRTVYRSASINIGFLTNSLHLEFFLGTYKENGIRVGFAVSSIRFYQIDTTSAFLLPILKKRKRLQAQDLKLECVNLVTLSILKVHWFLNVFEKNVKLIHVLFISVLDMKIEKSQYFSLIH